MAVAFTACLFAVFGYAVNKYWQVVFYWFSQPSAVFKSPGSEVFSGAEIVRLNWEDLLPESDRQILTRYQIDSPTQSESQLETLKNQILNSINAASDHDYQSTLISTETVEAYNGKRVSISGFIVPIDFHLNQNVQNFFFVPYFGACIHFPPPPPNQMLFAQIEQGFSSFDINMAYTLEGVLTTALFEDPLGTSAYAIEVHTITPFSGQPDTFRKH